MKVEREVTFSSDLPSIQPTAHSDALQASAALLGKGDAEGAHRGVFPTAGPAGVAEHAVGATGPGDRLSSSST